MAQVELSYRNGNELGSFELRGSDMSAGLGLGILAAEDILEASPSGEPVLVKVYAGDQSRRAEVSYDEAGDIVWKMSRR